MSREREKRDATRHTSGSVWKSARTDEKLGGAYVASVLKARQPTPPEGQGGGGAPRRRPAQQKASACAGIDHDDQAARAPMQPLLATKPVGEAAGGGTAGAHEAAGAMGAMGETRASFEWNPAASLIGGADDGEYEELLAPEGGAEGASAPPGGASATQMVAGRQDDADGGGVGVGSSLLDGNFDESESAASFAEALRAWRGEAPPPQPAATRPSRFRAVMEAKEQRPQPAAAAAQPTLADKVLALRLELGLAPNTSMADAVREANAAVGLAPQGSLTDQVGRLLRETGIEVEPGAAGGAAAPAETPATDPEPAGSMRPDSASRAVVTQTPQASSFYERFLEQKRKDGVA